MSKVYVTGDKHGRFEDVYAAIESDNLKNGDVLVVLGDAGLNYYLDRRDAQLKQELQDTGITYLIVRGNHEARPAGDKFTTVEVSTALFDGLFIMEEPFCDILYMIDGETYHIVDSSGKKKQCLVIGGAYSVDKNYRLAKQKAGFSDYKWFEDEQLSFIEMETIMDHTNNMSFNYVFTHTCPYAIESRDMFLPMIDQKTVDNTMEHFLDVISKQIKFDKWYLGHWHTDRIADPYRFMYREIVQLGEMC